MPRPPNQSGDIMINGLPYMLARREQAGPGLRVWRMSEAATNTARHTETDLKYGNLPAEIRIPFIWEDWSDGAGRWKYDPRFPNGIANSRNVDTSIPGQITLSPEIKQLNLSGSGPILTGSPAYGHLIQYQDQIYVYGGWRRSRFNSAHTVTDMATWASFYYGNSAAVFGTYAYFAVIGSGFLQASGFYQMNNQGTFTQATSNLPGMYFTVVKDRLWRGYLGTPSGLTAENGWVVANVAMGSDPTTPANWSTGFAVGESSAPITGMIEHQGLLVIGKADGLYIYISSDNTFQNILTDMRLKPHRDNGTVLLSAAGFIFYNANRRLLATWMDENGSYRVKDVTPFKNKQIGESRGQVIFLTANGNELFALIDGTDGVGTTESIKYLHKGIIDPNNPDLITWYTYLRFVGTSTSPARSMLISRISGFLRLYSGMLFGGGNTTDLLHLVIPDAGVTPQNTPGIEFDSNAGDNGYIWLSAHDLGRPTLAKAWRDLFVETDVMPSGSQIAVRWILDPSPPSDSLSFGTIVGTKGPSDAQSTTFAFPAGSAPIGYSLQPVFRLSRGASGNAPTIRKVGGTAVVRPDAIRMFETLLRAGEITNLRDSSADGRSPMDIYRDLRNLAGTGPVTLLGPDGTSYNVLVLRPVEQTESAQWGTDQELLINLKMIEF